MSMEPQPFNSIEQVIQKDKWSDFLRRFIDVLRIGICIVDLEGKVVVPPVLNGDGKRYGSDFLVRSFGFDFSGKPSNFMSKFQPSGVYWEAKDAFEFRAFSIPLMAGANRVLAYAIVGPVILNRKLEAEEYQRIAAAQGILMPDLGDLVSEIRVISFVTMKAILDLLSEVMKDVMELNLEKRKLRHSLTQRNGLTKELGDQVQDMYVSIHLNELLITILDVALNLTKAECGSIMLIDEETKELSIKVSRGISPDAAGRVRIKLGEGIAGLAAQQNSSFVISGMEGDNRIKPFLKRPDIKKAVVMPLSAQNRVFGVLNLHTKAEDPSFDTNADNLQYIGRLISTAVSSI